MKKIILRVKGGIGNQLFCYAAAKRLAEKSNSELVLDNISGFINDKYKRSYMLNHFAINTRIANPDELLEPFSRIRRKVLKWMSKNKINKNVCYFEQIGNDFDEGLLNYNFKKTLYLEGYWQSELYFKDIEPIIRSEFKITPPKDELNIEIGEQILNCNSVCIHVRWFDSPDSETNLFQNNIQKEYYRKAINYIVSKTSDVIFFVFSDFPNETKDFLSLDVNCVKYINHNSGDDNAYADIWLMSLCKHFIISNSTFSWWGAWLSEYKSKIVIAPLEEKNGESAWGFKGLIPNEWIKI